MLKDLVQPFDGRDIPKELQKMPRWTPWIAHYNAKRGKVDKIPRNARTPEYGISTASPEKWFDFNTALAAFIASKGSLHGVGFVMTDIEGVAGGDLDNCRDPATGVVAQWADEVVVTVNSYTEISPSGKGLRIFMLAVMDGPDWNNHEVGIELYGGSTPRFLTVTGKHYAKSPKELRAVAPGVLAGLRGMFGRASSAARLLKKNMPPMPDLLPEEDTPDFVELELPPAARAFLSNGECGDDRSRTLHSTAVALFSDGLTEQQVLSVLVHNNFTNEVALDHRRQDADRAMVYLWEHHCVAAKPKARTRALTAQDFDDVGVYERESGDGDDDDGDDEGDDVDENSEAAIMAGFDDVSDGKSGVAVEKGVLKPTVKKPRFEICTATEYHAKVRRLNWFLKGVLPRAEVSSIFGASGSGKTFAALHMACCIALGKDWYGITPTRSKVLYVAAEGASGMRDRLNAWCRLHGVEMAALDGWLYVLGDQPNLLDGVEVKTLVSAIKAKCGRVDLMFLDTMAQVTSGANENSGEDMGKFLGNARAMNKQLDATVTLIGHIGKDSTRGMRGWSGLKGAMDSECEVIRTNDFRAITVTKLKDGMGEGMEYRFTLKNVLLEIDLDDGDVTSAVAVEGEVLSESGARATANAEEKEAKKATAPTQKPSERRDFVANYLQSLVEKRGREFDYTALLKEVAAACHATQIDDVCFTELTMKNGQATSRLKADTFPALEKSGHIRIENGKLTYLEGLVEAPNPQN